MTARRKSIPLDPLADDARRKVKPEDGRPWGDLKPDELAFWRAVAVWHLRTVHERAQANGRRGAEISRKNTTAEERRQGALKASLARQAKRRASGIEPKTTCPLCSGPRHPQAEVCRNCRTRNMIERRIERRRIAREEQAKQRALPAAHPPGVPKFSRPSGPRPAAGSQPVRDAEAAPRPATVRCDHGTIGGAAVCALCRRPAVRISAAPIGIGLGGLDELDRAHYRDPMVRDLEGT